MIAVALPRLVSLMGRLLRGRWQAGCGEPALSWADWGRPGRLRVSLCPKGPTARGPHWQPIVDDIGSTWEQCRVGRIMATRTAHCARRAPGFGGGRLHCSHAPSHRRYVDADFEGMVLTALWEPAPWSRPSRSRLLGAGPPAAFFMRAEVGPPSNSRPGRQPTRGRRPHVLVS